MISFILYVTLTLIPLETQPVTITVYNATVAQCDASPFVTASGFNIDKQDQYQHRIIALSRDVEKRYNLKFGDSIYVTGTPYDGWWYFRDRMHYRWKNKVDLLINNDMPIGKWQGHIFINQ